MQTLSIKPSEVKKKWYLIDAEDLVLGRLASIVAKIAINIQDINLTILVASFISAVIAGLTIFGKAIGKRRAINNCTSIILKVGKLMSLFSRSNKQKKHRKKRSSQNKSFRHNQL